nr:carbohydrate ABC transporter permease [Clostridia bacterium]
MVEKRTVGERAFDGLNVLVMSLLIAVTLYPFLYVLFASLSNPTAMVAHSGVLLAPVGGISFGSYGMVLRNAGIVTGYRNTLFLVTVGTSVNMLMTSLGAYVLSKRCYMGWRAFNFFVVFTMFFGGGLIPFYLVVQQLGLINSRWAMILPTAISTWN